MRWSGLCLAAALFASNVALADRRTNDLADEPAARINIRTKPVSGLRRTGAILAAIGPGLFIRGTGSYLVGEKRTAKRLFKVGAIGLGGAAIGGAAIGLTGGYPPTMPFLPVLLIGGGMVFTTWWADIAVAANLKHVVENNTARARAPVSLELATVWLNDPYRNAGFLRLGGHAYFGTRGFLGRLEFGGAYMVDAENKMREIEGEYRVRLLGSAPTGKPISDGSRLYVRLGGREHRNDADHLAIGTYEVEVVGRLDLFHLDRTLRGTFIQLSTGVGVEWVSYPGVREPANSIFLATFVWGFYLGNRGEASIFYDHRRDTMVGGLPAYRAAGFVGSVGANVDWMLDRHWGARLQIDWGNAVVTTFGLRYQGVR